MTTPPEMPAERRQEQGVVRYTLMGLVALAVVLLVLTQRGLGIWALAPVAAGLIGSIMRFGPLLFLLALTVVADLLPDFADRSHRGALGSVPDLILSGAVLAYVIAHYRAQGMLWHIFPPDPRRREAVRGRERSPFRRRTRVVQPRRAPQSVSPQEMVGALLMLPIFVVLAQLLWNLAPLERANPGIQSPVWHGIGLAWLIGLGWVVTAGFLGYARRRSMTAAEATLYLQDELWAETRREQRRLNRWWVWGRHRRQREEDKA
jgi:hypothetical protein